MNPLGLQKDDAGGCLASRAMSKSFQWGEFVYWFFFSKLEFTSRLEVQVLKFLPTKSGQKTLLFSTSLLHLFACVIKLSQAL